MRRLRLDFEWQSKLSIRSHGLHRVVEDPSTRILCAGWQLDGGPVRIWVPPAAVTAGLSLLVEAELDESWQFLKLAQAPDVVVVAHNAEVEQLVLLRKFGVAVPLERMDDTAARAARCSLPRALGELCEVLGLDAQKDEAGKRVMMKLARARRPSREDASEFWGEGKKPEDYLQLYAYNGDDVRALVAVDEILPPLDEPEVWRLTAAINQRGLEVDTQGVQLAQRLAIRAGDALARRFEEIVGCSPASPKARGVLGMDSLDKASVRDELKRLKNGGGYLVMENRLLAPTDSPVSNPDRIEALEIRQRWAKSSVKKLQAFLDRTSADFRLRGSLVYCGAERTGRWSGAGVQPQNFRRGTLGATMDLHFDALHSGALELVGGDELELLSEMMRGFFVGPLLVGDFAQVEARALAWLAGQEDMVEMFRSGADLYAEMGSAIYGRPIHKKTDPFERFIGKESVLGCGYGLGAAKFAEHLDVKADVQVSEEFAVKVVQTFRRRFPAIVRLWDVLERGLLFVVQNGSRKVKVGPVFMGTEEAPTGFRAFIETPDGSRMYYHLPIVEDGQVTYVGRNQYKGGAWERVHTYGGKTCENVVQRVARQLLAGATLRVERLGLPVRMNVHDEVLASGAKKDLPRFEAAMAEVPAWAGGMPVAVECFHCERYRK